MFQKRKGKNTWLLFVLSVFMLFSILTFSAPAAQAEPTASFVGTNTVTEWDVNGDGLTITISLGDGYSFVDNVADFKDAIIDGLIFYGTAINKSDLTYYPVSWDTHITGTGLGSLAGYLNAYGTSGFWPYLEQASTGDYITVYDRYVGLNPPGANSLLKNKTITLEEQAKYPGVKQGIINALKAGATVSVNSSGQLVIECTKDATDGYFSTFTNGVPVVNGGVQIVSGDILMTDTLPAGVIENYDGTVTTSNYFTIEEMKMHAEVWKYVDESQASDPGVFSFNTRINGADKNSPSSYPYTTTYYVKQVPGNVLTEADIRNSGTLGPNCDGTAGSNGTGKLIKICIDKRVGPAQWASVKNASTFFTNIFRTNINASGYVGWTPAPVTACYTPADEPQWWSVESQILNGGLDTNAPYNVCTNKYVINYSGDSRNDVENPASMWIFYELPKTTDFDIASDMTVYCNMVAGFYGGSGQSTPQNGQPILGMDGRYSFTIQALAAADEAAANAVTVQINALPATVTLADKDAVVAARTAYDALTAAQKALVSNLATLEADEAAIAALEAAAANVVIVQINALPATVTLADKDAVAAARTAYEALTASQKALVNNLATLEADEAAIAALEAAAADEAAANVVTAQINALPATVTLADKDAVAAARTAYDALTTTQKALVSNLATLQADEAAIAALEATAADEAAANVVIAQINALPATVTLADKDAVAAARTAYDALTTTQKALVNNLATLEADEAAIAALEAAAADQAALDAAKAAAAAKVEAEYTAASWTVLANALALPETTNAEILAKATAINAAIAALVEKPEGAVPITTTEVVVNTDGSNKKLAVTQETVDLSAPVTITIPSSVTDAAIDVSALTSTAGSLITTSALPAMDISAATTISSIPVQASIPAGLTVSAPAATAWDGTINVPTVKGNDSVVVSASSGKTATVSTVIEIGYGNVPLSLSKAVRILIPGQADKKVGYYRNGAFTSITNILAADTQAAGDALAEDGDGTIDVGSDLVVWTKHFTNFVTYTETAESSGSGGGGSSTPAGTKIGAQGGTVSDSGITLTVPAGAQADTVYVQVKKLTSVSNLPVTEQQKLVSEVFELTKNVTADFSKAVTIKISFDKSKFDTDQYDLALCWFDAGSNKWVALDNCKVDLSEGTVSGGVSHFTKFAVIAVKKAGVDVPAAALSDISAHWAKDYINTLLQSGAISGYPDASFKPDNNITRAEFATVLVKAYHLPVAAGKTFNDTASHWAKDYIAAAYAAGVINGYSDSSFGPDDPITREQMAVMIAKAAKINTAGTESTFTDSSQVSAWAKDALNAVTQAGIMKGYPDGTFNPQGEATRAEMAAVIVNALNNESK